RAAAVHRGAVELLEVAAAADGPAEAGRADDREELRDRARPERLPLEDGQRGGEQPGRGDEVGRRREESGGGRAGRAEGDRAARRLGLPEGREAGGEDGGAGGARAEGDGAKGDDPAGTED